MTTVPSMNVMLDPRMVATSVQRFAEDMGHYAPCSHQCLRNSGSRDESGVSARRAVVDGRCVGPVRAHAISNGDQPGAITHVSSVQLPAVVLNGVGESSELPPWT